MRNAIVSYPGLLVRREVPTGRVLSVSTPSRLKMTITSAAVVHGNFRDPNPWSYRVYEEYRPNGYLYEAGLQGQLDQEGYGIIDGSTTWNRPAWEQVLLRNMAQSKLYDKIRGNLDLAIDIAERKQSIDMVKNLRKVINFARGGFWKRTAQMANGWLQYQYGWKPLMSTVYDVCNESSRVVLDALTEVKGKAKLPLDGTERVNCIVLNQSVPSYRTGKGKQACTYEVTLAPRYWDVGRWSTLNPVSLAWELVPYSFVVDWFYDVGSYLRNLESALLYRTYFVKGFVSNLYAFRAVYDIPGFYYFGPTNGGKSWRKVFWAQGKCREIQFIRTVLTSLPTPTMPSFRAKLGAERLASGAALLRQILDREFARSRRVRGK